MAFSGPWYTAWTDNEEDCHLLCEADELCHSQEFDEASKTCRVHGVEAADGQPTPAEATLPTYVRGESVARRSRSRCEGENCTRRVLLATYATGAKFEVTQQRLHDSLDVAQIQEHWRWNASTFRDGVHGQWFKRHQATNFRRGGAWKPYIIWQAFRRVLWGDWLIYHDASQYIQEGFSASVQPLLAWIERHREQNPCECLAAVRLRQTLQHEWQQQCISEYGPVPRDTEHAFDIFCGLLWRLGACTPSGPAGCCQRIWEGPTLQHAWSVWRKNRRSARFLRDWASQATDYELIAHLPFVDQSLNALLVHRWHTSLGIRPLWVPSLYERAWAEDADLGVFGRNDGIAFKHLNFVLDALHDEEALGRRLLWLVGLSEEEKEDTKSLRELRWHQRSASPAAWARSICIAAVGQPSLTARMVAAQLPQ